MSRRNKRQVTAVETQIVNKHIIPTLLIIRKMQSKIHEIIFLPYQVGRIFSPIISNVVKYLE